MVSTKYKVTWKSLLLLGLGLGAFLIYIYLFRVDIQQIIAVVQHIDIVTYVTAATFVVIGTFCFALSWYFLLNFLAVKLSVVKSYLYVWYGIFVDAVIPGESISGDITKIYLVTRKDTAISGKVVASLVVQRLMGMAINVACLLLGISVLFTLEEVSGIVFNLTLFLSITITIFLMLLIVLCIKEHWTRRIVNGLVGFAERLSLGHWKPQLAKIREEVTLATRMFHDSVKELRRAPKALLASLSFNVISWILELGVIYFVFLSIGFSSIHWSKIVVTYSILLAVKSIPIGVPFEAGLPEIAMSTLLIWLGVPKEVSFTVTILSRLLTMWLRFFIGFVAQQWVEIQQAKSTRTESNMTKIETEKV